MDQHVPVRGNEDLLKLRAFPTSRYEHYALTSLTAYCVYWLQKWNITTSLENVAVASHRMFPVKFAMVGWPQIPDITRTNRSVLQMRPKYRNLATSSVGKGVFLNQRGLEEAEALIARIGPPSIGDRIADNVMMPEERPELGKRDRSVHPEKHVATIKGSRLFQLYKDTKFEEAEAIDLVTLLNVYDHTPSKQKQAKLNQFLQSARDLGDQEVVDFLEGVGRQFKKYLSK